MNIKQKQELFTKIKQILQPVENKRYDTRIFCYDQFILVNSYSEKLTPNESGTFIFDYCADNEEINKKLIKLTDYVNKLTTH